MTSRGGEVKRFLPERISRLSSTRTLIYECTYIYRLSNHLYSNAEEGISIRETLSMGEDGKFNPIYCRTNYMVHIYRYIKERVGEGGVVQ